jgi:hypothetical protein
MTKQKAIQTIETMISTKQEIIQAEQELIDSWGQRPEDDSPTKTAKIIIQCMQKDIEYLQYIKSQIKNDSKKPAKSLRH